MQKQKKVMVKYKVYSDIACYFLFAVNNYFEFSANHGKITNSCYTVSQFVPDIIDNFLFNYTAQ